MKAIFSCITDKDAAGSGIINTVMKFVNRYSDYLYHTCLYQYLCDCKTVSVDTYVMDFVKFDLMQKNVVRIIHDVITRTHAKPF